MTRTVRELCLLLVVGYWLLVVGCWLSTDSCFAQVMGEEHAEDIFFPPWSDDEDNNSYLCSLPL